MKNTIRLVLVLAAVIAIVGVTQALAADLPASSAKTVTPVKEKSAGTKGVIETGTAEEGNFGIVQKLGLTPQQTEQIKGILEASKPQRQATWTARVDAARKLTQLALLSASEGEILTAATELGKAAGSHAMQVSQTWGQVKGILTPEQQTKLQELMKERQDQRAERRAEVKEKVKEKVQERRSKGTTPSSGTDGSTK